MTRAVLSIGSNLGDREANLAIAVAELGTAVVAASAIFQTPPWGGVEQGPFLNAVLLVDDPDASGWDWLRRGQAAERRAHRVPSGRWGPRTLDVDVISVDRVESDDPELTLPHPHAHERAFVLVPWLSVDPAAQLPGHGSVAALVDALADAASVRRLDDASDVRRSDDPAGGIR